MKPRITLVEMPFSTLTSPHLGLSILKAEALKAGLPVQVEYGSLRFAEYLGYEEYNHFQRWSLIFGSSVEMLFLPYAGYREYGTRKEAADYYRLTFPAAEKEFVLMEELCRACDGFLSEYLDKLAELILTEEPDMVGTTWTFQQLNADLALLKRLKEKKPDLITFLGGSSSSWYSGQAVVDHMPQVDYVFAGESDEIFAQACMAMANRDTEQIRQTFPCVLYAGGHGSSYATKNMNSVAIPDFTDYFRILKETGMDRVIDPILPIEGSRGCWWGCKGRCRFCGIHPDEKMIAYREKSSERFVDELNFLSKEYGVNTFWMSDCILSVRMIHELPVLLEGAGYKLFAEVKSNMTASEMEDLRRSGFISLQPGIESLQDDILQLMNKGNTAIRHVEFLKNARTFGIHLAWNMMKGLPTDQLEWYHEMEKQIPMYVHLEPPNSNAFQYLRNSRFRLEKERFHVEVKPCEFYRYLFGKELYSDPDFIEEYQPEGERDLTIYGFMDHAVDEWKREYYAGHMLSYYEQMGFLAISDTRECAAQKRYAFDGIEKEICLGARQVIKTDRLLGKIREHGINCSESEFMSAMQKLMDQKLLLVIRDEVLFLAVPKNRYPWASTRNMGMGFIPA